MKPVSKAELAHTKTLFWTAEVKMNHTSKHTTHLQSDAGEFCLE